MLSEFGKKNLTKFDTYARYAPNFKCGQKNSIYIFMPIEVANKVKRLYKVDAKAMNKMFDQQLGLTPKYLRKWFYNKTIIAKVPESVADFYEGRSPAIVGPSNYLTKTQQADHVLYIDVMINEWGKPFLRVKERKNGEGVGAVIIPQDQLELFVQNLQRAKENLPRYSDKST